MFGNLFSSFFGRDCDEIESDPRADMFEKEICRNMRQFEESFQEFSHFSPYEVDEENPSDVGGHGHQKQEEKRDDPQSLRDHILSPHINTPCDEENISSFDRRKRHFHREEDRDLDDIVKNDPDQLERILKEPSPLSPHHDRYSDHYDHHPGGVRRSQSVIISTIRKPDGSVEHRKTVTDSDGNKEITVTTTPPTASHDQSHNLYISPSRSSYFDKISNWLGIK